MNNHDFEGFVARGRSRAVVSNVNKDGHVVLDAQTSTLFSDPILIEDVGPATEADSP